MTEARRDPDLPLPEAAGPVPSLALDDPELALHGPAGPGVVLLEGERASALVAERGGVERLVVDGRTVAAELRVEGGVVVNLVASPALLRRERVAGGRAEVETLLVPPRLPLLALQLGGGGAAPSEAGAEPRAPLPGSVRLLPEARALRWHAGEGCLVAVDDARPEQRVALRLAGSALPEAEPHPDGGLRVRFRLPPPGAAGNEPPGLVVAAGPRPLLAPLPHLAGHARAAAAAPATGVSVESGVRGIDEAVEWARARLASAACRTADATRPWAVFWAGLGALAAGDQEAARRFLGHLEGHAAGPGTAPAPLALAPGPLPLLLAARLALTLGETGPVHRLVRALGPDGPGEAAPEAAPLWSLALGSAADALRWAVGEDEADRLRARGTALAGRTTAASGAGLRLPMAGRGARAGGAGAALRSLLSGGAVPAELPAELASWGAFRAGRAEEGWSRWRSGLDEGLAEGGAGRGCWDRWSPEPEVPRTGLLLAGLVHGLLGWMPDAPVGRAVLAPRLPGHLTRFAVRGLRCGDATVDLAYERTAGVRRLRLEPAGGRAPLTLALEPRFRLDGVREVRLDGEGVELAPREEAGEVVVPLQIPLDAPRTLEIEGVGEGA